VLRNLFSDRCVGGLYWRQKIPLISLCLFRDFSAVIFGPVCFRATVPVGSRVKRKRSNTHYSDLILISTILWNGTTTGNRDWLNNVAKQIWVIKVTSK
jgi:hypothetical protein